MSLKVVILGYYPRDYCYQCMFSRNNEYGDSLCMLHNMDKISAPDYERPGWCPFDYAEEVKDDY